MKNAKTICLIIFLTILSSCSPLLLSPYSEKFYDKLNSAQPIRVSYLQKDSVRSINFEMYFEKKADGYRVFAVHTVFGRIFVLYVTPENVVIEEDMHRLERETIELIFETLETIEIKNEEPSCDIVTHINADEALHLRLSSHCQATKTGKN